MYEDNLFIRKHFQEHIQVMWSVYFGCVQGIIEAKDLLVEAFVNGNQLLLCGNGGSAADCQHLATEFVPMGLPAISLTTDSSFLTAHGNDSGFYGVFGKQVAALGMKEDVLLAISTSGKSPNVLKALEVARERGLKTILLTGDAGLPVGYSADVQIKVPSKNTQYIQEAHASIEHVLWLLVKDALKPKQVVSYDMGGATITYEN